jgi:hypothetical protein
VICASIIVSVRIEPICIFQLETVFESSLSYVYYLHPIPQRNKVDEARTEERTKPILFNLGANDNILTIWEVEA